MVSGIEEINSQGWIWKVATWVKYILIVISYWRRGNNPLSENMKYDTKLQVYITNQNFILDGYSELKPENGEQSGRGILHVRNQVTLNENTIYVFEELYMDTVYMVWVYQYLYFVFQMHNNNQFQKKEG